MVAPVPSHKYEGTAVEPVVTLTDGGRILTPGTDYDVTYSDNTEPYEWAQVRINGKGNYTGTANIYFEIYKDEGIVRH